MRKFLLIGLVILAGCSSASPTAEESAREVIDFLVNEDFEKVHDDFLVKNYKNPLH